MIWAIVGLLLTFASAIGSHLAKSWSKDKADLFISPQFKMQMEHQWYIFFGCWKVFDLILGWIIVKLSSMISDSLFLFFAVFFGYLVIDNVMFWWNFNDDFYIYLDLLWTFFVLAIRCVSPYTPETIARIKSLF